MLWTIALLVAAAALVKSDCVGENGDTYPDNTGPYPSGDGCNTCQCKNGVMKCTQDSCGCRDYRTHAWVIEGSTMISNEGCTRCTCTNGEMDCTHLNCGCEVGDGTWVASGTSFTPDCNSCHCHNVGAACTLMGCSGCYTVSGYKEINATWVTEDGCMACTCKQSQRFFGGEEVCLPQECNL